MKKRFLRSVAAVLAAALLFCSAAALELGDAQALVEAYYAGNIPESAYDATTAEEFIAALGDPYSTYFTAEEYAAFLASMADTSLVGIGVIATADEAGLRIEQVLAGSGAESAGLREGDILLAAGGVELAGMTLEEAVGYVQGAEGSWVRVVYLRSGERWSATVRRGQVVLPATDGKVLDGGVGYIQCTSFGEETFGHFSDLIAQMDEEVNGYLIDLRDNSGGLTDAAAQSAGLFVGTDGVIQLRYPVGKYELYRHTAPAVTDKPVVVLVNDSTASAAEAFAAILRDAGRGLIVGSRTFGKGVAQGLLDESSLPQLFSGDALKLTVARFYSPVGNSTHLIGVLPDLLLNDDYASIAGWLLLADAAEDSDAVLTFSALGRSFTLDLSRAETEDQLAALEMVLNALDPSTEFFLNGAPISSAALFERLGGQQKESFTDLHEAQDPETLDRFLRLGLIQGDERGAFRPRKTLTRAQLAQMLYTLFNSPSATAVSFSDVAEEAWYAPAVRFAAGAGLLGGVGDGRFDPDGEVTTTQLIAVLGRLAQELNCDLLDDGEWWAAQGVTLYPEYPDWCQTELWLLADSQGDAEQEINLLWDDLEALDPAASVTRESAVYGFARLLRYLCYMN